MVDEVTERIRILLELEQEAHDKAVRQSAREIAKLERSYDPLSRATIRYQQEEQKLTQALEKGTITTKRHAELMDRVQSEYDQTTAKIIQQNAALAASSNVGGGVVGMLNRNKAAVQGLGYQIGDFAVQVGGGTSAITAFAQQGSQMLGMFGAWGAIAGAALAVTLPLVNSFWSGGDAVDTFASAVEALDKEMTDLIDQIDLLNSGLNSLAELNVQREIDGLQKQRRDIAREYDEMSNRQQRNARAELKILDEQIAALEEKLAKSEELHDRYEAAKGQAQGLLEALRNIDLSTQIGQAQTLASALMEAASNAWSMATARASIESGEFELGLGAAAYGGAQSAMRQRTEQLRTTGTVLPEPPSTTRGGGGRKGGGGGSGGKSYTADDILKNGREQIESLERQLDLIGQTEAKIAALTAKWEMLDAAKEKNVSLDQVSAETGKTLRDQIESQANSIGRLTGEYEQAQDRAAFFEQQQESIKDGLLDAIIEGENFADTLANIAKSFARAALEATLFGSGPLGGGGGIASGILGALTGKRASGGPVQAGGAYLVNENTPNSELFVPSRSGAILNVAQAQSALRSAAQPASAGGGVVMGEIGVTVDDDGKMQAYVKRMGLQAASAGAAQAIQTTKGNLRSWNQQTQLYGAPK